MALLFGPEKTQRREKSGLKNFCIPIFYTVEQDEPYKNNTRYLPYQEILWKYFNSVNDSCQKEKPSRNKLSNEGQN